MKEVQAEEKRGEIMLKNHVEYEIIAFLQNNTKCTFPTVTCPIPSPSLIKLISMANLELIGNVMH